MNLAFAPIVALSFFGCTVPEDTTTQWSAAVSACHLEDDVSITPAVDIHACEPGDTRKTTICHIPPGNPANAHTICVGNSAVAAHTAQHHDTVGPCAIEVPCEPGDVDAGVPADTGPGGGSGSGGEVDGGVIL